MSQGHPPLKVRIPLKEVGPEFILGGFLNLYSGGYQLSIGSHPALCPSSSLLRPSGIQLPLFLRDEGRRSLETLGGFLCLYLLDRQNSPLSL